MAEKSKHWWETLGGLLTGIAALITACTGLMVALLALNRPESASGDSLATTQRIATSNSSETRTITGETQRPSDAPTSSGQTQSIFVISLPEQSKYVIGREGQAARYELLSGDLSPATAEADVLRFRVLFANLSENPNSRMNFESRAFQLVINGREFSPKENFNYMVLSKRVREEDVLFQIPKGLKQATLKMGTHVDAVDIPLDFNSGT
jgi:hypothetical protein